MSRAPEDGLATGRVSHGTHAITVEALASTLGLRDGDTGVHSGDVARLAVRLGSRLGLRGRALRDLGYAAQLHDIGKVGVPDAVLRKPAPLTEGEREVFRRHAIWGAQLVAGIPGFERVAEIIRHHHERFDGAGYPDALAGQEIPLEARILAVADSFVAMTEDRPYRPALSPGDAELRLLAGTDHQFDPDVVEAMCAELEPALA